MSRQFGFLPKTVRFLCRKRPRTSVVDPASVHIADQTRLFPRRHASVYICPTSASMQSAAFDDGKSVRSVDIGPRKNSNQPSMTTIGMVIVASGTRPEISICEQTRSEQTYGKSVQWRRCERQKFEILIESIPKSFNGEIERSSSKTEEEK